MIYYAHSKQIYNTKREKEERVYLKFIFYDVCCPNLDMGELGSIDPYLKKVRKSNVVVFSEYKKHIGKGVHQEIMEAYKNKIPIILLRKIKKKFKLMPVFRIMIKDPDDWAIKYRKVIA